VTRPFALVLVSGAIRFSRERKEAIMRLRRITRMRSYRSLRKLPLFPLIPLLPAAIFLSSVATSIRALIRVRRLERRLAT
jgi:hypothetical protein